MLALEALLGGMLSKSMHPAQASRRLLRCAACCCNGSPAACTSSRHVCTRVELLCCKQAKLSYEIALARDMARDREDDGLKPEFVDGELSDDDSSGGGPRLPAACAQPAYLVADTVQHAVGMLLATAWLCVMAGSNLGCLPALQIAVA